MAESETTPIQPFGSIRWVAVVHLWIMERASTVIGTADRYRGRMTWHRDVYGSL